MRTMTVSVINNLLLLLLLLCNSRLSLVVQGQEQQEEQQEVVPFETIMKGAYSGIEDELEAVYRTNDEYLNFFMKHHSDTTGDLMPLTPTYNFRNDNLLIAALYLGTFNSGGYDVEIKNVVITEEEPAAVLIEYITSEPGPDAMVTMALTQPYHVIEIGPLPDTIDQENVQVRFQNTNSNNEQPVVPQQPLQFLITFAENVEDPSTVVQKIQDNLTDYIANVQLLGAVRIGIIDFNSYDDAINAEMAMQLLKKIDGVATVELDSVVSIDNDNNIDNPISIGVMETTTEFSRQQEKEVVSTTAMTIEEGGSPLRLILTIDKDTEMSSVAEAIADSAFFNDIFMSAQILSSLPIMFVDLDKTKIDNNQITKAEILSELQKFDGVNTVEEDGIVSISSTTEDGDETSAVSGMLSINDNVLIEDMDIEEEGKLEQSVEEEENDGVDSSNNNEEEEDSSSSSSSVSQIVSSSFFALATVILVIAI